MMAGSIQQEISGLILSDKGITQRLTDGSLVIEPLEPEQIQPASVDMHLGKEFLLVDENRQARLLAGEEVHYSRIADDKIVVPPQSFILVMTKQFVKLPGDLTAFVQGLSSMGRMGLLIQNDGWVDPGFEGTLTLAFLNANRIPIELQAGCRICQLAFALLDQPATDPYHGKYQGYRGVIGSKPSAFQDGNIDTEKP
jgi:dCTP deaminase